jgi:hypothetical protein
LPSISLSTSWSCRFQIHVQFSWELFNIQFLNINTIFHKFYSHVSDILFNCFHTWMPWYCKQIGTPWCAHTHTHTHTHTHLTYEVQVNQIDLMMVQKESKHVAFCILINWIYQLRFDGIYYSLFYLFDHKLAFRFLTFDLYSSIPCVCEYKSQLLRHKISFTASLFSLWTYAIISGSPLLCFERNL